MLLKGGGYIKAFLFFKSESQYIILYSIERWVNMMERDRIIGKVIGPNSLRARERIFQCWTNAMPAAETPQPLDLAGYMGQVVEVSGRLHGDGDLWEARFVGVIHEESYKEHDTTESSTGIISGYTGASMGW
jgi:hypothetical protein